MEQQEQIHLGDIVKRASEEIRSWPAWAQPFRPSDGTQGKTGVPKAPSQEGNQSSCD
jgi:hypothetical protein